MNIPDLSSDSHVLTLVRAALEEDGAFRDVTTLALVDPDAVVEASILTRVPCRVSGGAVAMATFRALDPAVELEQRIPDGADAQPGDDILLIRGKASTVLSGERVALNFMQRLTGIATATTVFVKAVEGTGCTILDTRKTVPGFRALDKYAVACGGGTNHRMGLSDMVLIKDNHRRLWRGGDSARLDQAVAAARAKFPGIPVEVEVETFEELDSALSARPLPEWIMLDNMPPETMRVAVGRIAHRCKVEASGGITLRNVRAAAEAGVDAVSLGCLTHSVIAVDLSLEMK